MSFLKKHLEKWREKLPSYLVKTKLKLSFPLPANVPFNYVILRDPRGLGHSWAGTEHLQPQGAWTHKWQLQSRTRRLGCPHSQKLCTQAYWRLLQPDQPWLIGGDSKPASFPDGYKRSSRVSRVESLAAQTALLPPPSQAACRKPGHLHSFSRHTKL